MQTEAKKHSVTADTAFSLDDLRNSIERHEVVPYFQPIVELRSGRLWGFEVLARWHHAQLGFVPPDKFVSVIESSDLVGPFFESMLTQAFTALPPDFPEELTLSVNVSPIQLRDRSLSSQIDSIAERTRFPLGQLIVEIMETALVDNMKLAIDIASDLKTLGTRLALDDFGTGYSSLRHLNSLPFDEIKIDKSFILSMCDRRESRKIAAAVVGMGQSLGITTIAEGIEEKKHADMLFYLGCELGQGWHYGRPVPAAEIPTIIARKVLGPPAGSPMLAADMANSLEAFPMERLAQLQAIYDGAPVGLCLFDRNFRYVSHNKRLSEMSALSAGPRLGKRLEEVAPIFYLQTEPYLKRALEGEAISNLEALAEGPQSPSEFNTLLLSLQPVRDGANEVIGISMAAMDITVPKRMEKVLLEHEDHYRRTLELNVTYPYTADPDGKILWVNPLGLTGVSGAELEGYGWRHIVHADDLPTVEEIWATSLHGGDPFDVDFRIRAADGTWRRMRARASARRGDGGKILRWYGLVEDIDARNPTRSIAQTKER